MLRYSINMLTIFFFLLHLSLFFGPQSGFTRQAQIYEIDEPEMVFVGGGVFTMGDTHNLGRADEYPLHDLRIDSFYMSKYEVNQYLYDVLTESKGTKGGAYRPAIYVNWYEAVAFCNALSIYFGYRPAYTIAGEQVSCDFNANGYRLPTEAEWEYAARGGPHKSPFIYAGSDELSEVGYSGLEKLSSVQPVGQRAANALGIFDLSGNVAEWCWDNYSTHYYASDERVNPCGPQDSFKRVVRGGSYITNDGYARVSARMSTLPDEGNYQLGIRLVRTAVIR
jgi:sulfatase modifying factor 1